MNDEQLDYMSDIDGSSGLSDIEPEQPENTQQNSDEEDDVDNDASNAHGPLTTSEKRRAQNEIFRAFATQRTEQITETEVQEAVKGSKDEQLSIADILAKQETSAQIVNPRDYQTELFQKAKDQNIIAVLDTGTGKTHIATLLLQYVLDQELENRAKGQPPKVAFFLVDSVNLVFQQSTVLRCGLDQKVDGICGAMGPSLWKKPTWDKLFDNNMVIVCTAEVLVECLMHSFISISRINILIFDEAHHAKSNHPYARIMRDYYMKEPDLNQRPRIFGMTASPVDANEDIVLAAKQLESLLHCKIATTSDPALMRNNIIRPMEQTAFYPRLRDPFETPLHTQVKARYGYVPVFSKLFKASKLISSELGPWAADMYWSFAFSEEESRKRELRQERRHHKSHEDGHVNKLNEDIAKLRKASEFIRGHSFNTPAPTPEYLSSKVLLLHKWLQDYFSLTGEARCIVFVEKRQTARLLNMIFKHIGGPHLHGEMIVGVNSTLGELNVSLRNQVITVAKFRRGEINCLFSTSVAEEGLDIPQCNLVVRFDLYKTMIAYVQSRGRARHRNSKYLHMMEEGNPFHRGLLMDARSAEMKMRNFCQGLTGDHVLNEVDADVERLIQGEREYETFSPEDSDARLTYRTSLSIVAHFVASLPAPNDQINLQPTYYIERTLVDGAYLWQCEIILPEFAPIVSLRGKPHRKKAVAKCAAAFAMCYRLWKEDYLDKYLLPTYTKQLPAMRNAHLAISEKSKGKYAMRIKPDFWQEGCGTFPDVLYLTVLDADEGLDRPHQPLGLLTRVQMPQLPSFPLYLKDGKASNAVLTSLSTPMKIDGEILQTLLKFTRQVFLDLFNKDYEYDLNVMPYWLVPIRAQETGILTSLTPPESLVDMDHVHYACSQGLYKWTPDMKDEDLADKYIVDPGDGGRRFYSIGVDPRFKPRDPIPENWLKKPYMKDILSFSNSLWKASRAVAQFREDQPVIQVDRIPFRRNLLASSGDKDDDKKKEQESRLAQTVHVCPEPLAISPLNTKFVAMCYAFPAIIHRIEEYLVALDACKLLGLDITPSLALEALTKDTEVTDENGEEKINFKSGMGPNYERLEFIGDCFLKMATSISTFVLQPDENEFEFHVRRMLMLCNRNLFKAANGLKLFEYIRSEGFSRRNWYPKGMKMTRGRGAKSSGPQHFTHDLGEKTIADVCEAFIGAAFMQDNKPGEWIPESWDMAVKAVKTLVNNEDHLMERYSDYYDAYQKPKYQLAEATATQLDLAKKIEEKHPYHFKYPRLLRSAFVHPSQAFMWEKVPNYQRLEFLGDSLLDMVFIIHLFYTYPEKDPHWLTEHKTPMVSNKFLGAVSVKLGFHTHIRQNNAILSTQIRDYVAEIEEAEREANGSVDYWIGVNEPPKCLADVVEAYVAAMFVDSEFDFNVVQKFFDMHLKRYFLDMTISAYENFGGKHPTTRLSKVLGINYGCGNWRMSAMEVDTMIPGKNKQIVAMVMIHDKIYFDSLGQSGRYARLRASEAALNKIEGIGLEDFRQTYGCNCVKERPGSEDEAVVQERLREAMGPAY